MTTFIRGNDKGFMLLHSLIVLFVVFLFLLTMLELEYRKYAYAKAEYESLRIIHSD